MKRHLIPLAMLVMATTSVHAQLLFSDAMSYPNGSITTNSSGLWIRHSGSVGDSLEVGGRYEVNQSRVDDIHRWFDPVATNGFSGGVLWASFVMKMTNLPANGGGTYFAHFMDATNGGVGGGGSEFRGRIFALTNNAYPGAYRLGVGNATTDFSGGTGGPNQTLAVDLALNTDYQVVMEYDIDNADATLWVNPASIADPNSGPTGDTASFNSPLAAFAFRQSAGEGVMQIANLRVGQTFNDVVVTPAAIPVIGLQPVAVSTYSGNPMTLTVLASGKGALSYQWHLGSSAIGGATANQYSVGSVSGADQGNYYCSVTNSAGGTNSLTVFVSVNTTPTAPIFTSSPQNTTNGTGGVAAFSAAAVGTGPITYQWKLGSNVVTTLSDGPSPIPGSVATISGSSTATLTISNLTKVDGTNYTVTATGGAGSTSTNALLVVLPPAVLISKGSPYTQNFDSLTTSGTVAWNDGGTLPGWYASQTLPAPPHVIPDYRAGDGTSTAGAVYSFGTTSASDRALGSIGSGTPGNFAYGFLLINDTALQVVTNITVAYTGEQWRNGGNTAQQRLAFSYFTSFGPITNSDAAGTLYSWTTLTNLDFVSPTANANAGALDGNVATNRTVIPAVTLTNVTLFPGEEIFFRWLDLNDAGNDHGLALDDLTLTYNSFTSPNTRPIVTSQPQNVTNNALDTATLTAGVSGLFPLTFQWYKGSTKLTDGPTGSGSTITGSTNSLTLTIDNVFAADAGDYYLAVTNSLGGTNTHTAHLTVIDPVITTQPDDVTDVVGDNGNFFVSARGTPALSYQWLSNGVPIAGATTNVLNIPVTLTSATAKYSVTVMNGSSASVTSGTAKIILVPTTSTKIAQWNFNSLTPDADTTTGDTTDPIGGGTVTLLPGNTTTFAPGTFADPASPGGDNTGWNTTAYPAAGTGNKTGGVQFSVSTAGFKNLVVTWEERHSATASKYARVQYSTDGVNFVDSPTVTTYVDPNLNFQFNKSDLTAISGINNNGNFAFRIVTEFQSTATGSGISDYVGSQGGGYGTGGTIRFDWLNVFADPTSAPAVTPIPLNALESGGQMTFSWTGSQFALQGAPALTGVFTNITSASPYTIPMTGAQGFFRLSWLGK